MSTKLTYYGEQKDKQKAMQICNECGDLIYQISEAKPAKIRPNKLEPILQVILHNNINIVYRIPSNYQII